MGSGQCSKGLKAESSRDVQGSGVTPLDNPYEDIVAPLLEGNLEGPPEQLPAERLVGGDVEHAAFILVVIEPHRCNDLAILGFLGDPTEVFYPDQPRALGNPSMDFPVPENQLSSQRS